MFDPMWEAVFRLENLGLKVLAVCCNGLAANRRLFSIHQPGSTTPVYKVPNPHAHNGERRSLFFLSDPPHLIKTVRNCWANYKWQLWVSSLLFRYIYVYAIVCFFFIFDSLHLQCNGMDISWKHLTELYEKNRAQAPDAGLALLPKLKYEHVHLTSYSKMRVDLAAQVSVHIVNFTIITNNIAVSIFFNECPLIMHKSGSEQFCGESTETGSWTKYKGNCDLQRCLTSSLIV